MRIYVTAAALAITVAAGSQALAGGASASSAAGGKSGAEPAFADVPPCHWAATAVQKAANAGIFVGFPPDPAYDSVNALRQVFEGLRCRQPGWSLHFLEGAPQAFSAPAGSTLAGFTLSPRIVSLGAQRARLAFELTAVVDEAGTQRTLTRQGTVTAAHTKAGWKIAYADLAKLDLPLFPR